jgi:tetratricopeptide (TPR) repeat protein
MATTKRIATAIVVGALVFGGAACGGSSPEASAAATTPGGAPVKTAGGAEVSVKAHNYWKDGSDAFDVAEKQGWNDSRCDSVADKFEDAADAQGGKFAEAYYMVGLAHQKCGRTQKAMSFYNRALSANQKLCKARVALGVDALVAGREQQAQQEFDRAVRDDPQCTEGYVNLGVLQRRHGNTKDALNNLRRALAIDAQYLPAFSEMALLYVDEAQANPKALDLAEVVCSQAQKIKKDHPPVYNTWGLIDLKRGQIIDAAAKFQKASELDPKMFEAHMNFARITIGFRGYQDAATAYEKALQLQPRSFDAQLGVGVAYRGLEQNKKAEEAYKKAIGLASARPEPYYNLGVLYQDFMNGTVQDMKTAKSYFDQYISRAGADKAHAATVEEIQRRCKLTKTGQRPRGSTCVSGRFQNIDLYLVAMKEMDAIEKLRKEAEAMEKQQMEQAPPAAAQESAPPSGPAGAAPAEAPKKAPAAGPAEAPKKGTSK